MVKALRNCLEAARVRGPHGGYKLAREARRITAADILRAARTIDNGTETPILGSSLVSKVVAPALAEAENVFSSALARLSVADLAAHALRSGETTRRFRR